ncbi:hypothetical protein [Klebsiella pneumoniae]|uniref:hypothetical protein n=1 Tax=Klebsiella pneumoniae TaxID=573 RepID=UPI002480ECB4|nr:hypothetical protein [Klebsiella pneumoniae]HBX8249776.1 hypothetical protein [Klebsiella pneumoniae]HBY1702447.1 hypothetical protein [Klebsiella pneumoniae]
MYYRNFIITSIEAERILAMKFDEAFAGVKKNVINRILIMAVATMICQTSRFNNVVYGRINRARSLVLKGSVTATAVVLNVYGLIQDAANSADNLKVHNSFYYNALYANHLEMMYFLIEPVITGVPYLNPMIISDDELAELLIKLMR